MKNTPGPFVKLACIAEARRHIQNTDALFWRADVCRIEGELRRQAGAADSEVEACFSAAIETAQRQAAKSFELRAATSMASLWLDRGRRADARELLLPVYEWFTEGLDTPDLREAKAVLDRL